MVFPKRHSETTRPERSFSDTGGFTLIEVLIALAVTGLMVPAVIGIFVAGSNYLAGAGNETAAVKIARERMEEVRSMDFNDIDNAGFSVEDGITEDYGVLAHFPSFKRVTEVTFEESAADGAGNGIMLAVIKVTVYWDGADNPQYERSVQLKGLHTNR